jgi:hypothetical protein
MIVKAREEQQFTPNPDSRTQLVESEHLMKKAVDRSGEWLRVATIVLGAQPNVVGHQRNYTAFDFLEQKTE